ncbi:MAG: AbrB/MazE/SpoVT family DNA-binding domain-containing protein [Deltaproteobacteria bacterium]|nr:AbrB/MazE/SpoVT family DNA-binding domain-containing protein [Deltaproteobacteria bacterium]
MPTVTVSSKGQIVMPKEVRDALGIEPKQKLFLKVVRGHVEITPLPMDPVKGFCGVFEKGSSLTMALLRGRKEEARIEEEKID